MAAMDDKAPESDDRYFWPGEVSLLEAIGTGEYRTLDLRVLDQQRVRVDIRQQGHLLAQMSDEYVTNVIRCLLDNVECLYVETIRRSLYQMYGDLVLGRLSTDIVAQALGAPALTDLNPIDWLEATPLMRALRAGPPARQPRRAERRHRRRRVPLDEPLMLHRPLWVGSTTHPVLRDDVSLDRRRRSERGRAAWMRCRRPRRRPSAGPACRAPFVRVADGRVPPPTQGESRAG